MTSEDHISWQDLLDLVAQLEQGSYETASIDFSDVSVRFSKNGALPAEQPVTVPSVATPATASPATSPAAVPAVALAPAPVAAPAPAVASAAAIGESITAPMIGVFYRCPSPGAPPFVQESEEVQTDTTIGIIEVMKLMSPVTAGVAGRVVSFSVTDGEQVEFGQELAVVDTGGQR